MLHVACVRWGEAFGVEYVERLFDAVRRNLPDGFKGRFVCFTDRPEDLKGVQGIETAALPAGLEGWWNKLALFAPGAFSRGDRVLYFDLDTCIVGPLDAIAAYEGEFAILRDAYRPKGLQSSVMAWEAGSMDGVWNAWNKLGRPEVIGGDQAYLEDCFAAMKYRPDRWQDIFPGRLRSYKVECTREIPKGTSVVFFHGLPRPHQVLTGWVPDIWRVGGGGAAEFVSVGTVPQEKVLDNVRSALDLKYQDVTELPATERLAVICAGGPSLDDHTMLLANLANAGAALFAVNQVDHHLRAKGLLPHFHVMLDARPELVEWVNAGGIKLYGSMCDPTVLAKADAGGDLAIWHPLTQGIEDVLGKAMLVGGGCTVGTRAVALAYVLGFRRILCVGFDSCVRDRAHHAYPQALNDADPILDVAAAGRTFRAAPWMIEQAQQFRDVARELQGMGCSVTVMGDGLLAHLLALDAARPDHASLRCAQLLEWLGDRMRPLGAEVGVFAGDLSQRLLRARSDLTLLLVDSWAVADPDSPYADSGAGDFHARLTAEQQEAYYQKTRHVTHFAGKRAILIRAPSIEAATRIADASLDFVFIDADHSYEGCKADILAWLPKIKPGGFLSGHDYDNTDFPGFGVKRAVDEQFPGCLELGKNFTWRVRLATLAHQQRIANE